jgi:hypothetical protein
LCGSVKKVSIASAANIGDKETFFGLLSCDLCHVMSDGENEEKASTMKKIVLLLISLFVIACLAVGLAKGRAVSAPMIATPLFTPNQGILAQSVNVNAEDMQSFQKAIDSIGRQVPLHFIAEDFPLAVDKELVKQPLTAMKAADAIEYIAECYDYTVKYTDQMVVFQKKYSVVGDLPHITLEESKGVLDRIIKVLEPHNPKIDHQITKQTLVSPIIEKFVKSLTDAQMETLKEGNLAVASLSPMQQNEIWRFALNVYVQEHIGEISSVNFELEHADTSSVGYGNVFGKKEFGRTLKYAPKSHFRPFTTDNILQSSPPESVVISNAPQKLNSKAVFHHELTKGDEAFGQTKTFAEIVSTVNGSKTDAHLTLDAELKEKRVTVSGLERASASSIANALGKLYNLSTLPGTSEKAKPNRLIIHLSPRKVQHAVGILEVSDAIRRIIPTAFYRCLQQGVPPEGRRITPRDAYDLSRALNSRPARLRQIAVSQLEERLATRLRESVDAEVPYSEMSPREQSLHITALLMPGIQVINRSFLQPPPEYISEFQKMDLSGRPYLNEDKQWKFLLNFKYSLPDGRKVSPMGISNMRYSPEVRKSP